MAGIVYILCAVLSFSCSLMLMRGYRKNKFRLLLWSAIGFCGFTLNNVLLFVDIILIPETDLAVIRTIPALIGVVVMIYGLIEETV